MIERKGIPHDRSKSFFKEARAESTPKANIRRSSNRSKESNKIYEKVKRAWRKEREAIDGGKCAVEIDGVACSERMDPNPHHIRGRLGKRLYDKKNFLPGCWKHHRYLHDNPAKARELGYIQYDHKSS